MTETGITNANKYRILADLKAIQVDVIKSNVDMSNISVQASRILAYIYDENNGILTSFIENKLNEYNEVRETSEFSDYENILFKRMNKILYYGQNKLVDKNISDELEYTLTMHQRFEIPFAFETLVEEILEFLDEKNYNYLPLFNSDGIIEYYFSLISSLYMHIENGDKKISKELNKIEPNITIQDKFNMVRTVGNAYDYYYLFVNASRGIERSECTKPNAFALLRVAIIRVLTELISYISTINLDDNDKQIIEKQPDKYELIFNTTHKNYYIGGTKMNFSVEECKIIEAVIIDNEEYMLRITPDRITKINNKVTKKNYPKLIKRKQNGIYPLNTDFYRYC